MSGKTRVVKPAAMAVPIRKSPAVAKVVVLRALESKPRKSAEAAQKAAIAKANPIAGSQ